MTDEAAYAKVWNDHDADARSGEHPEVKAMAAIHAARWWCATYAERLADMAEYAALKARLAGTVSAGTVAEVFAYAARAASDLESLRAQLAEAQRERDEALDRAFWQGEQVHEQERRAEKAEAQRDAAVLALPGDLRADGWSVAVHNDYRLNGESHTFWLFTKDGRAIKGEGKSDAEALAQARLALSASPGAGGREQARGSLRGVLDMIHACATKRLSEAGAVYTYEEAFRECERLCGALMFIRDESRAALSASPGAGGSELFREGAEAMRDAAADWMANRPQDGWLTRGRISNQIRALPLPEKPSSTPASPGAQGRPSAVSVDGLLHGGSLAPPPAPAQVNQCDGCMAGRPLDANGNHVMGEPGGYPDLMACQRSKYDAPAQDRDRQCAPCGWCGGDPFSESHRRPGGCARPAPQSKEK